MSSIQPHGLDLQQDFVTGLGRNHIQDASGWDVIIHHLSSQGCAVSPNAGGGGGGLSGKRKKRDTSDTPDFLRDVVGMFEAAAGKREKRNTRSVVKFIEMALVLDKAMVRIKHTLGSNCLAYSKL